MKPNYYIGPELNFTPANGLLTVYTCQFKAAGQILAVVKEHNARHVRLGYLGTFQKNKLYNTVIPALLETGLKVTLEYSAEYDSFVKELLSPTIWKHHNFIPLIKVAISSNQQSNNESLIIEDTNTGHQWSQTVNGILDSNRFTPVEDIEQITGLFVDDMQYKKVGQDDSNNQNIH